jgi:hypothetical protein
VEQATGDAANVFRTWNYPIKEMYKIVWEQMSRNGGFLDTPAEGIKRVTFFKFHVAKIKPVIDQLFLS